MTSNRALGAEIAGTCSVVGCEKSAHGPLCSMHAKRKQRGTPMDQTPQERLSPWGRLLEAVIAVAECDTEDDALFERLSARARMAGVTYAKALGVYTGAACREKAVPATCDECPHGRQAVPEGAERESGRDASLGEGDPRAGGNALEDRAPEAGGAARKPEGRSAVPRRRSVA